MMRAGLLACLLVCACAGAPVRTPPRDPDSTRARAALATLVVDNRSTEAITIAYRHPASRTTTEVAVGQASPRSIVQMAPVPAGEPLVLLARTTDGLELVLAPRTFTIDGVWTWVVPPDARFIRPGEVAR